VDVSSAASRLKAREGKADIGWHVAVHAQQLTQITYSRLADEEPLPARPLWRRRDEGSLSVMLMKARQLLWSASKPKSNFCTCRPSLGCLEGVTKNFRGSSIGTN
jgi:hypothetical protein